MNLGKSYSAMPLRLNSDVTIGMSAYGNYQTTLIALTSLFLSVEGDFELILVDDCSPDDTLSLFLETRRKHPFTKVFSFEKNLEYSGSLNAILSHAQGKWVLFLSNDIFITPGYLREIFGAAKLYSDFGIIRGCSNFVDNGGIKTHNIPVPEQVENLEKLAAFAETVAGEYHGQYLLDEFLTGDAFLVNREVLNKIGTFDPLFYGYFADHDFGIRAQIANFKLALARGAFAFHQRSANFEYLSQDQQMNKVNRRWSLIHENWERFKLKYGLPDRPYEPAETIPFMPWNRLSEAEFDPALHYCAPGDYTQYLL